VRHVIVAQAAGAVLAALVLDQWLDRWLKPTAALIAVTTPLFLWLQGTPAHPAMIQLQLPAPGYAALAQLPDGVLVEPPLSPQAAGVQQHLLFQMTHQKTLLTGHAMWVDRVRPPAWDRFMSQSRLLSGLAAMERGGQGGTLRFGPEELPLLRAQGLRWFAVNRSAFPLEMQPVVRAYRRIFRGLFGPPVVSRPGLDIYDADRWTGRTEIELADWTWPDALIPAGPSRPLTARRPAEPTFLLGHAKP
jgi:hypothetical protein